MNHASRNPGKAPKVELEERIDARLLASLSQNFRSPYEALSELVDNALASALPGKPVTVSITGAFRPGGTLKIISKGGSGMGTGELRRFLYWGTEPGAVGLNRYGQGGKAAVGYLGEGLRIRSNRHDEDVAYEFEDAAWLVRPGGKTKKFPVTVVKPVQPGAGVVQIEVLNIKRTINSRRLDAELAARYRPALQSDRLRILIKGKKVEAAELPLEIKTDFVKRLTVPDMKEPQKQIEVDLKGWLGIAAQGFEGKGGVRSSAFGRVITANEYFGHHTSSYKASLNSLVGEVDLSCVPVVLNKTGFDSGSEAWETARTLLYELMRPFVSSLLKRKDSREPSDSERLRAMEAKDLAHKALDKIAQELPEGRGDDSLGRKAPEAKEIAREASESPQRQGEIDRAPATPPPAEAVGRLRRRGRSAEWDVRALDSSIRSARTRESGYTEIIINCNFPLYRERSGDFLYMLETGLLEELKPSLEEEKTVEDYHRELNEALRLALSMKVTRKAAA